jgi:hypothetical protein
MGGGGQTRARHGYPHLVGYNSSDCLFPKQTAQLTKLTSIVKKNLKLNLNNNGIKQGNNMLYFTLLKMKIITVYLFFI